MRIAAGSLAGYPGNAYDFAYQAGPSLSGFPGMGQSCTYDDEGNLVGCDTDVSTNGEMPSMPPASVGCSTPLTNPVTPGYTCVTDCAGNCVGPSTPTSPTTSAAPTAAPGSALTPTQLNAIIGGAAQTGVSVLKATQSPTVIPGTNAIYNPATGQILGATSLTSSQVESSISSFMPIILLGLGAVLVLSFAKK
jgi:hypothetical protein